MSLQWPLVEKGGEGSFSGGFLLVSAMQDRSAALGTQANIGAPQACFIETARQSFHEAAGPRLIECVIVRCLGVTGYEPKDKDDRERDAD